ncbi:MAG TPA: adenosylcobinamide amidohydrolase [Solirubrobacteraceae bacterium]
MRLEWPDDALLATLPAAHRCLSSAVLGGGLTSARHWLNLQVPRDYARTDPEAHLTEVAQANALDPAEVIGMLTAADVRAGVRRDRGPASAVATVGIGQPLAAAGRRPRPLPRVGTINVFVLVRQPLSDAALVTAVQTATEAKAQALADAGVRALNHHGPATGTATDAICIATPPGAEVAFAGPATAIGAAIAHAVHGAVLSGARIHRRTVAARGRMA